VIHNHFHKCGASCFKKNLRSKSGVTICRFGCVHFEKVEVEDDKGKTVLKKQVKRGWRRIPAACFADPADKKEDIFFDEHEAGKFMPRRDDPYSGMSHPTPQVCLRCNVDVKYLGRCPTDSDMKNLEEQIKQDQQKKKDQQKEKKKLEESISGEAVEAPSTSDRKGQQEKKRFSFFPKKKWESWSAAKKALWSVVLDAERYMKDVQHYVGEYAAKKFEVARSLLPELHSGLRRLQNEREQQDEAATTGRPNHTPNMTPVRYRAYRTLLRLANSMNRCISKSQAEMSYQLLYESECFLTRSSSWERRSDSTNPGKIGPAAPQESFR
jgi:hypothetical protein